MSYTYSFAKKPDKWPVNRFEANLDEIMIAYENFIENPSYRTREVLISLYSNYDLNQATGIGEYRITEYEVSLINSLYVSGLIHQIPSLRCYLYELVGCRARLQKMVHYMSEDDDENTTEPINIGVYENGLILSLKLYYFVYQAYTIYKDKNFADKIIEIVEMMISEMKKSPNSSDALFELSRNYSIMLNDLSYFHGNRMEGIWKFERDELFKLFELEAKLIRITEQNITERPLMGVLMTQISNYILKSRNGYNNDWICKYMSTESAESSCFNHEIWMRHINDLNDEKEGKVLETLFEDTDWTDVTWIREIDFTPNRKYYVSSFSKSLNNEDMREGYGKIVFGYKNDRIGELISPLYMHKYKNQEGNIVTEPTFSLVMAFDVLYDETVAKEELNYLFHVIDIFDATNENKHDFLEDILQYWLLSVKESKWASERERRYVLFLYDEYEYFEMEIDDGWLKEKTSMFILPDFIIGRHPKKEHLRLFIDNKRHNISLRSYYYCDECFNRDFDEAIKLTHTGVCPICGSNCFHKVSVGNE